MLRVFVDGGFRDASGKGAFAFVILDSAGNQVAGHATCALGTSNELEYQAAIAGLKRAMEIAGGEKVLLQTDSQLVQRQLSGDYKVRKNHLKPLHATLAELVQCSGARVEWIPRKQNRAHKLVEQALQKTC